MEPVLKRLKEWRNKVGAHKDLDTALMVMEHLDNPSTTANPIPRIDSNDLNYTVASLIAIVDAFVTHHLPSNNQWHDNTAIAEIQRITETLQA